MSAEPVQVEDPNDPEVILRDLPERERGEFLRQYHAAIDAAHDPSGYQQLRRLLHAWRLTAISANGLATTRNSRRSAAALLKPTRPSKCFRTGWTDWRRREFSRSELPRRVKSAGPCQLGGFPAKAFDALITTMATVAGHPDDPLRTLPTSDPYVRRAVFGTTGLVTYVIDDARGTVTLTDVTWAG